MRVLFQTIRSQLLAAFALMLLLIVAGAASGLRYAGVVHERLERVYSEQLVAIKYFDENRLILYRIDRALRQWELAKDPAQKQAFEESIGKDLQAIMRLREERRTSAPSPVEVKLTAIYRKGVSAYAEHVKGLLSGTAQNAPESVDHSLFDELDRRLGELIELNENAAHTDFEYGKVDQEKTFAWIAGSLGAACFVGVLLAVAIVRRIATGLDDALVLAQRVAGGDLTDARPASRRDEIGRLLASMAVMVAGLVPMMRNIRHTTETIYRGTEELTSGSQDLAQRTQRQVEVADDLATAAGSLHAAARANADCAKDAIETAATAQQLARQGSGTVTQLVGCMQDIEAQAREIAEISGLIDTISFKTNILALNAAVEAAHAGSQGMGFAAVAAEVRSLSTHVAAQAKQIGSLVQSCSREVAIGKELVSQVHAAIQTIAASAGELGEAMRRIATASKEQLASSERVSAVVSQVDEDIKRNATVASEALAMTAAFNEQAARLNTLLDFFKLPPDGLAPVAVPVPTSTSAGARPRLTSPLA